MARIVLAIALLLVTGACEPMPCFGDSCSCYGDPEAPNANAGCADCTPEATCETLRDRVEECGHAFEGSRSDCEKRVRATHSCLEGVESTDCDVIAVACPQHDSACYAELVISGRTSCDVGLVPGSSQTASCASGRCVDGVCVECDPLGGWDCPAGFSCNAGNRCVPSCESDADCGPDGNCFAGQCDPPLGTPCVDSGECGTLVCETVPGKSERICTTLCLPSCEPGSLCGCPAGFSCGSLRRCFPA